MITILVRQVIGQCLWKAGCTQENERDSSNKKSFCALTVCYGNIYMYVFHVKDNSFQSMVKVATRQLSYMYIFEIDERGKGAEVGIWSSNSLFINLKYTLPLVTTTVERAFI